MKNTKSEGNPHSHLFTIADDEAVDTLISKIETSGTHQPSRERLLQAFATALKEFKGTTDDERKAFFHGLITGYSVALKLGQADYEKLKS